MKKLRYILKKQPPERLIAGGFAGMILIGTILLLMPFSVRENVSVSVLDAFFTSTSAVCVTGLVAIDPADHFTAFGQGVLGVLIQFGGLGLASIGVGLIIAAGKKVSIRSRTMVKEALNVDNYKGIVRLIKAILFMTLFFELIGALLCFPVFLQDFPPLHALGISIFHSIASFNNAGFDILGGLTNLIPYQDHVYLNIVTILLIILGGIGFLVMLDIGKNRSFRKLSLHSKVVLVTSAALIVSGTLLLKATEHITWLGALFQSVSARTAGFSTYPMGEFSNAGLFVICILMFIGASPGSTGGGVKTSTFFALFLGVKSACTKAPASVFHRNVPKSNISRACAITVLSVFVACIGIFIMCVLEPDCSFMQIFFEVISALGTAGLSTGITPSLGPATKLLLVLLMFTGRIGAFTLLSVWIRRSEPNARYTEENISIG